MPVERENSTYRTASATRAAMVFGATFACAACKLRFARRDACPQCGGTDVVTLDRDGRAAYRARTRRGPAGAGIADTLARWAPEKIAFPLVLSLLLFVPALGMKVLFGDSAFEKTWITPDVRFVSHDLSRGGLTMIALAIAGVLLFVFLVASRVAAGRARGPVEPPRRMRVHGAAPVAEATELTGTARLGTVEITSAITGSPCLAFGVYGSTDAADIADAEGGDFDLVLDDGERLMVSLEHAVLVVVPTQELARLVEDPLAELLEDRAITTKPGQPIEAAEILLRDGDRVTVAGTILGGATVTLATGHRARVLAGTEDQPLEIRVG